MVVEDLYCLARVGPLVPCDFHCIAHKVASLLSAQVFPIFGVLKTLIFDKGPNFTAQWFKFWALSLGVKQCLSSAYHPQFDGQIERMNRVVEVMHAF